MLTCSSGDEKLIAPCKCAGSSQHVHATCLVTWFKKSVKHQCELCKSDVKIRKKNHRILLVSTKLFWISLKKFLFIFIQFIYGFQLLFRSIFFDCFHKFCNFTNSDLVVRFIDSISNYNTAILKIKLSFLTKFFLENLTNFLMNILLSIKFLVA